MSSGIRMRSGTPMAVWGGIATVGALGGMWWMVRDIKPKEGAASPYKDRSIHGGTSDVNMTSSDVAAIASGVPKPNKERLPNTTGSPSGK